MATQPAHATDSPQRGAERGPAKPLSPDQVIAQAKKNLADTGPTPPKKPAAPRARAPKPRPNDLEQQYKRMEGSAMW